MAKTGRQKTGLIGEELAEQFLRQKGLRILERNFRAGHGEIDIIAEEGNTLVFIEVKTSKSLSYDHPVTWVDERKQHILGETAEAYLCRNSIEDQDCRFDIIAVELNPQGYRLEHIKDAFWLE